MNKCITYGGVVVAAAVALSGLGIGGAGASATASRAGQATGHAAVTARQTTAVPGAQLWAKRYNGPANRDDNARSVAVSPAGDKVFVTGDSTGTTSVGYATVAYNAATGAQLWAKRYGPGAASSLAVSPTGRTVFVTGYGGVDSSADDYATVAYNAATGDQLWAKRYSSLGNFFDTAFSVAVSRAGDRVFVTGSSTSANPGTDYATVAYNAATGDQLWAKRYSSLGNFYDEARSVAVSPAGDKVFVTGYDAGTSAGSDYATVAYNAATGAQLWVTRYVKGSMAMSVAVSPTGATVYVTGDSVGTSTGSDYGTVAYNATTGAQLWATSYNGPGNDYDHASSVAVSPTRGTVYVTGESPGISSGYDYATVAYNATTGAQLWAKRYNGPGNGADGATSVAVSPSGNKVFVTGASAGGATGQDYLTITYGG